MFHTLDILEVKFFVFITLQVTLSCGMEFFYLDSHFTMIIQGCGCLAQMPQHCNNLLAVNICTKQLTLLIEYISLFYYITKAYLLILCMFCPSDHCIFHTNVSLFTIN